MTKRMVLLATAISVLALSAPTGAAAGTPRVHCGLAPCGAFTVSTASSQSWSYANGLTTTCTGMTGTGNYTSETGGTISLIFQGCVDVSTGLAWPCTSPGQTKGTVVLGSYSFDNIYLTDDKTKPGFLITNVNTTYVCFSAMTTLTGGLVGELEQGCSSEVTPSTFRFEQVGHGTQKYMQSTGTGTKFDLQTGFGTTSVVATGALTASSGKKFLLTCL